MNHQLGVFVSSSAMRTGTSTHIRLTVGCLGCVREDDVDSSIIWIFDPLNFSAWEAPGGSVIATATTVVWSLDIFLNSHPADFSSLPSLRWREKSTNKQRLPSFFLLLATQVRRGDTRRDSGHCAAIAYQHPLDPKTVCNRQTSRVRRFKSAAQSLRFCSRAI